LDSILRAPLTFAEADGLRYKNKTGIPLPKWINTFLSSFMSNDSNTLFESARKTYIKHFACGYLLLYISRVHGNEMSGLLAHEDTKITV
jgi:hypothetical protein